jgi:hypothetical protein
MSASDTPPEMRKSGVSALFPQRQQHRDATPHGTAKRICATGATYLRGATLPRRHETRTARTFCIASIANRAAADAGRLSLSA